MNLKDKIKYVHVKSVFNLAIFMLKKRSNKKLIWVHNFELSRKWVVKGEIYPLNDLNISIQLKYEKILDEQIDSENSVSSMLSPESRKHHLIEYNRLKSENGECWAAYLGVCIGLLGGVRGGSNGLFLIKFFNRNMIRSSFKIPGIQN